MMKIQAPFSIDVARGLRPLKGETWWELSSFLAMRYETVLRLIRERGAERLDDEFQARGYGGFLYFHARGAVYHRFGGFTRANPSRWIPWERLDRANR